MRGRVFLVETSVEDQNKGAERSEDVSYPLGISYIDSFLKQEGFETVLKDYSQWNHDDEMSEIKNILINFKPDVVGISMMTMSRVSAYHVIKMIKEINPETKIVLGGMHPTLMYEQLLLNFPVEAVVIGEAEHTMAELADAIINKKELTDIMGIAYIDKGNNVIKTPPRPLLDDLDSLPFPSHEAFMTPGRREANMLSTRGCPFKCSFCSLHQITKRLFRTRSYINVIDEIEHIIKNHPQVDKIGFQDDTFNMRNDRVIDLCKEIVRRGIHKKVSFLCSMRLRPLSDEMLSWMVKANFKEVKFGMETGSRDMLKAIHKGIDPDSILEAFRICAPYRHDIRFVKYLMVGFPGETWETIEETVQLVDKMHQVVPMDFFQATPLWVYPGIEVYDIMKEKGQITDDFWLTEEPVPRYTIEHSYEEIMRMAEYISVRGAQARGKWFFFKLVAKRMAQNPQHQIKRIVKNGFGTKLLMKNKFSGVGTGKIIAKEDSKNLSQLSIKPTQEITIEN
jgi:anaerobic magnesium-protoporphyrin IX monomethyl ester cyclase